MYKCLLATSVRANYYLLKWIFDTATYPTRGTPPYCAILFTTYVFYLNDYCTEVKSSLITMPTLG